MEETCEANSRGAVAVAAVRNTGNNVVGFPADHTDIAGQGYGTEVAVLRTHPRSHKMGWSVKGKRNVNHILPSNDLCENILLIEMFENKRAMAL